MGASSSRLASMLTPLTSGGATTVNPKADAGVLDKLGHDPRLLSTSVRGLGVLVGRGEVQTWLHVAVEKAQLQVVRQMFNFLSGSNIYTVRQALKPYCRRMGVPLPSSSREGLRMASSMCNSKGQSPLMLACAASCPELVKLLLEQVPPALAYQSWC
ncbi:hypothetical protein Agub_g5282 [Astrephomene gubernaculifera]|uniref:Uncharacterized protein n=1 Tax=Astrephomene gubernaculifera TaxID=47775 RepID=A0AAD3HJZ4_9CHLO|nr:hypothetical protein Agub_g5282 [Astrephomene gubernaculifera]